MPLKHSGKTPHQIAATWKKTANALPMQIANVAHNFFLDNFRLQGFQGDMGLQKWPARAPGAERNQGRALLVNRGTLRRALTKQVTGRRIRITVVGPAEKYAAIHNTGGVTHPTVTPAMRGHFFKLYKATGNKKYLAIATTKKQELTVTIPQRKFIGNSRQLNRKIDKMIIAQMKKAFA